MCHAGHDAIEQRRKLIEAGMDNASADEKPDTRHQETGSENLMQASRSRVMALRQQMHADARQRCDCQRQGVDPAKRRIELIHAGQAVEQTVGRRAEHERKRDQCQQKKEDEVWRLLEAAA